MTIRVLVLGALLAGALIACSYNKVMVPPVLRGATAQGGWWGACPPINQTEADSINAMHQLALSPEFNGKLEHDFPRGSSERTLVDSLQDQRFHEAGNCSSDQSIKRATFYAKGTGILSSATVAEAYWQTDGDQIVWTKGPLFGSSGH